MVSSYLLIDSQETLDNLRQAWNFSDPSVAAVAVSKYGLSACARGNVAHSTIEDFYSVDELIVQSRAQYDNLTAFCDHYDRLLSGSLAELALRGITPLSYSFYELKILVDTVASKIIQGYGLLAKAGSSKLIYRKGFVSECISDDLAFDESSNLFGPVLEHLCLSGIGDATQLVAVEAPPMRLASKRPTLSRIADVAFERIHAKTLIAAYRPRKYYMLFFPGRDIPIIIPPLVRAGYRPLQVTRFNFTPNNALISRTEEIWARLRSDPEFTGFFGVKGMNYFSLIESRLRHLITRIIPRAVRAYDHAAEKFQRDGPPAFSLTAAVHVGAIQRSMMKAAQDAGAPLVSYQEGAGFGSVEHPINDYVEAPDGDFFLCYGTGNVEYHDELIRRGHRAKPFIPVGSASLDHVYSRMKRLPPPEKISSVMYVSSCVQSNRQHQPYNGFTDTAFRRSQLHILNCIEAAPHWISPMLKPHQSDTLKAELSASRRRRVEILDGRLEDYLDRADLFVIDFPSTVLLTCCLTNAHIFVLAEHGATKLEGSCLAMLRRRAHVFFDVRSLTGELDAVFHGKRLEPMYDDDYLHRYCTYLHDGRSAERAVHELIRITAASERIEGINDTSDR